MTIGLNSSDLPRGKKGSSEGVKRTALVEIS